MPSGSIEELGGCHDFNLITQQGTHVKSIQEKVPALMIESEAFSFGLPTLWDNYASVTIIIIIVHHIEKGRSRIFSRKVAAS